MKLKVYQTTCLIEKIRKTSTSAICYTPISGSIFMIKKTHAVLTIIPKRAVHISWKLIMRLEKRQKCQRFISKRNSHVELWVWLDCLYSKVFGYRDRVNRPPLFHIWFWICYIICFLDVAKRVYSQKYGSFFM